MVFLLKINCKVSIPGQERMIHKKLFVRFSQIFFAVAGSAFDTAG
jgi:hypothetical protein